MFNLFVLYFNHSLSLPSLWPLTPPLSRDKARLATDSELDQDLSDRLGLGSSDTLTNGSHHADVAAAKRLAKRLFNLDGFRKSDVARHLSKKWAAGVIVMSESVICLLLPTISNILRQLLGEHDQTSL